MLNEAPKNLNPAETVEFLELSKAKISSSLERLEGELGWFIDKQDYANHEKPWHNSQDAIPRAIQKLAGIYPQAPPLKQER